MAKGPTAVASSERATALRTPRVRDSSEQEPLGWLKYYWPGVKGLSKLFFVFPSGLHCSGRWSTREISRKVLYHSSEQQHDSRKSGPAKHSTIDSTIDDRLSTFSRRNTHRTHTHTQSAHRPTPGARPFAQPATCPHPCPTWELEQHRRCTPTIAGQPCGRLLHAADHHAADGRGRPRIRRSERHRGRRRVDHP